MGTKDIKLTQEQIRKMKHAIGFKEYQVNNGKYNAYRNYYACEEDNADWNEIVDHGLARKRADPFCKTDAVFHLTKDGLAYLSELIGVEITEED